MSSLQFVARPVVPDVDVRDRQIAQHGERHEHRRDRHQHGDDSDRDDERRHHRDEAEHHCGGLPARSNRRSLQSVVELGALVGLELDLGGDVEDLVHRPPKHLLAERDAQFVGHRLGDCGEHEQRTECCEAGSEVTRVDLVAVGEQVQQCAADEQLACDGGRRDDARRDDQEKLAAPRRVDERDREADGPQCLVLAHGSCSGIEVDTACR